jgi:hypothetical protein
VGSSCYGSTDVNRLLRIWLTNTVGAGDEMLEPQIVREKKS